MDSQQGHKYFTRSKGKYPPVVYRGPRVVHRYEMNLKSEEDRFFGPRLVERFIETDLFGKIKIE